MFSYQKDTLGHRDLRLSEKDQKNGCIPFDRVSRTACAGGMIGTGVRETSKTS